MNTDLPVPGSVAAVMDIGARLRVFDFDESMIASARACWTILEPDARPIALAYWRQWQRCFGETIDWAPHEVEKMVELGCVFLRDRFLSTAQRGWIESVERSVAAAFAAAAAPETSALAHVAGKAPGGPKAPSVVLVMCVVMHRCFSLFV